MSLDVAIAAIRARAESVWPGIEAAVLISWPNEAFDKPVEPDGNGGSRALPFVAFEVIWNPIGDGSIGAPGNNLARRWGHIWAYAFIPQGSGEARAHQLASEAAGMFELQSFSSITCEFSEPSGSAASEDGNYFGQAVSVPFYFDETA